MIVNGLPVNKYVSRLVERLCNGEITQDQFNQERLMAFPESGDLFSYALTKNIQNHHK